MIPFSPRVRFFPAAVAAFVVFAAAGRSADMPSMPMTAMPAHALIKAAVVVLQPTAGNDVHGVVRFTQVGDGVHVVADVTGLKPGEHGFHIHEYGDLTSTDGTSTGGHFNPAHQHHGSPAAAEHHEGDLGNLKADVTGHATLDFVDASLALNGANSILGRGVIVHADADDLVSQPVGNAGKRVAAGVIGAAKGE
ncbi:MAG TPA: superoxide dismutase family protein [Rariglobus sp.]|jgi:Cu-Zn family superoxide dismutase|nr:superoxide dismutase family protein [Rariglobus sp.]